MADTRKDGGMDQKEIDLDRLLSECGPGWTITVKRIRPAWCAGVLDKFEADPHEPINVLDLRDIYGGRELQITVRDENGHYQGSRRLQFPIGPREDGKPIEPDDAPRKGTDQLQTVREIAQMFIDSQASTSAAVTEILKGRIASLEADLARQANAAPAHQEQKSPIDVIRESVETMKEIEALREAFGGGSKDAETPGIAEQMIEQYFQIQLEKEKQKIAAATQAAAPKPPPDLPARGNPPMQTAQAMREAAQAAPRPNPPRPGNGNGGTHHSGRTVDDLDDVELAVLMRERWANMAPDQQEIALNVFMGNYSLDDLEQLPDDDGDDDGNEGRGVVQPAVIDIGGSRVPSGGRSIITGVSLTEEDAATLDDEQNARGAPGSTNRPDNGKAPPHPDSR